MMPLAQQVIRCLDAISHYGESRHSAKQDGTAQRKIFSGESYTTSMDRIMAAIRWIVQHRRPDLRELRSIRHDDWYAYMSYANTHLHGDSPHATLAALHKLEYGLRALRWWSAPAAYVPLDLVATTRRSQPRGGFSYAEAQAIIARLDSYVQIAALLGRDAGLRMREVTALRGCDIDHIQKRITIRGKGGRVRTVTWFLDDQLFSLLLPCDGYVFAHIQTAKQAKGFRRTVQRAIARTRKKLGVGQPGQGMHALRACYAAMYIQHAIAKEGVTEDQARANASFQLGHNRISVTYRYAPRVTRRTRQRRRHD